MTKNENSQYSINYPLLLTTFMKRPVNMYPDDIGVVYRNPDTAEYFRFTWREWYKRTCKLTNALKNVLAVKGGNPDEPGDRIGTIALNHHYHIELYYAVPCCGAVLHTINMRLSLEHIVFTIRHAKDRIIFFDDIFLPLVENIYDQIEDIVEAFVYISDKPGLPDTKIKYLFDYHSLIDGQLSEYDWPYLHEDTYATLCYTTGTTGQPKGVMFSHRQLYLMILHLGYQALLDTNPNAVRLGENTVYLINTPLYHIHGWGQPYYAVFDSTKIVLSGRYDVKAFFELVETEKVTNSNVVPTVLALIVESDLLDKYDLSSLKKIGVGGGALSLELKKKAEKRIPGFSAPSGYGMTETAPSTIQGYIKRYMWDWPEEELEKVKVKAGVPIPGLELKIADENGNPVAQDDKQIGEICFRGPWVMKEYYNDPEQTAEVWREGWFHTGDMATIDKDGYVTIVDRMKELIRFGAEIIPTILLEKLTEAAEFVSEAAFVGVPHEVWGQRPMALVALSKGSRATVIDVVHHLQKEGVEKGRITQWMLPDYVVITDDIPKTSVGKIDKKAIRENMEDYLSKANELR